MSATPRSPTLLLIAPLLLATALLLPGCGSNTPTAPEATPTSDASERAENTVEKGPVKLTVSLGPKRPRLSDTVKLEVRVRSEDGVEIHTPVFGQGMGDFLIRDFRDLPERVDGTARERGFTYTLEPQFAGRHLIRAVAIEFTDRRSGPDAKRQLIESEPLEVSVTSEWGDEAPSLAQLVAMEPPRPMPRRIPLWWWLAGGGVLLVGAGVGIWYWRRSRATAAVAEKQKTPQEIAREALVALLAERLPEKGEFREFYVRLTGIVRRYIEQTTGIHAPEQTTEEFLRDPRTRQVFSFEQGEKLASFLEAADLVKYAGVTPGQRQLEEAVARAQEFIGLPSAFAPMPEPAGSARA